MKRNNPLRFLFFILCAIFPFIELKALYFSQCKQDKWVNENIFKNKRGGVFLDIGAHDGITINNTYFFEKELGWNGICIEPMPDIFEKLRWNRKCLCIQGGIAEKEETCDFVRIHGYPEMLSGFLHKYDPRHLERVQRELKVYGGYFEILKINTYTLNDILEDNALYFVDFMSLDTEGGELDILRSIDFKRFKIHVITVENNYHDSSIFQFLSSKGYRKRVLLGCDEIYELIQ